MSYVFKQEKFEGPLELLLELIEKEELSITEISLAKVSDEYLSYVRGLGKINPDELAEFLVVAAQLMLIKSRSLLPQLQLDEEEQASIEELEHRLALYKRIRELSKELQVRSKEGLHIYVRESFLGMPPTFFPPSHTGLDHIKAAFESFLAALPKLEKLVEERIKKVVSLEEKISHIRSFLNNVVERAFSDILRGTKERTDVIVSFLAILELARQRFVDLDQERPFGDIVIKRI